MVDIVIVRYFHKAERSKRRGVPLNKVNRCAHALTRWSLGVSVTEEITLDLSGFQKVIINSLTERPIRFCSRKKW